MAVAAPARRAAPAAPAPAAPPGPKKRPRDRPRPGTSRSGTAKASTAPARKPAAPKRRKAAPPRATAAPARKAPARRKAPPRRRAAAVIPIAAGHAGRAAVAVSQLPESGLIHRLTRGRAWIGVLGILLIGIVALNVVTLSFAASSGRVDEKISELSEENSMLRSRVAQHYGQARVRHEAAEEGLAMPTEAVPRLLSTRPGDVAGAASRLAAAGKAAAGPAEAAGGAEVASGEAAAGGEETAAGTTGESEFTPEEEAIYNREWEELVAAEGAGGEPVTEYSTE